MAFNKARVMEAARRAVEKGQLDKAIREYLKVVREDPKDVRVWLKLGDLYAKSGAKQDASETYLKVARFYSEQGFNRKAIAVYEQIRRLDPRLVEVNLKLAELYRDIGLLPEAMQHFERVAAFFHREGKTREALATIRQLVELDPENVATRIKLAELYSAEGDVDSAVAEFSQTLDYLRTHQREDDLLKVGERLLWHQPENIELNRELAAAYLRQRDPRRALQKLQVCFKADSRDVETLAMLAQAFQQLEQKDKTISVLRELARVLAEDGQMSQAAEVHENILQYAPDDPDSIAFLGRAGGQPSPAAEPADEEASEPTERLSADDLQVAQAGRMTGAFPLVGDQQQPDAAIEQADPQQEPLAEISIDDDAAFDDVGSLSGEVHADEIIKILTESDVYVKYGLHQKAIDHLRRVFELDPGNIEAREQLKEILLSQGREEEAIGELLQLARQTATADPQAAEMYLRELVSIDASRREAYDLANQYRLRISEPDVEVVTETPGAVGIEAEGGDVMPVDDAELAVPGDFAAGSPAPGPNPSAPEVLDEADLVLDEGQHAPPPVQNHVTGTQEIELEELEEADPDLDHDFYDAADADPPTGPVTEEIGDLGDDAALVEALGDTRGDPTPTSSDAPLARDLAADPLDDPRALAGELDRFADPAPLGGDDDQTSQMNAAAPADDARAAEHTDEVAELSDDAIEMIDVAEQGYSGDSTEQLHAAPADTSTALEDDLDEADFFLGQGLIDEAREILDSLAQRYPGNPLVASKLSELAELQAGPEPGAAEAVSAPASEVTATERTGADGLDVTERARPQVMLEKPVAEEDADTHYDLGLAYKEMGLYDDAIKSFEKVVSARGVQCYLMIGLCYREQGAHGDAIERFKSGLYVDGVSEREKYSLYYELGLSYEQLGDTRESLYYAEMVMKKDPAYRDVRDRVARLRRQLAGETGAKGGPDDTDAAIDRALPGPRGR